MNNYPVRRVVVTGAAGFIGSHLVDSLLSDGVQVLGIDNLSTGRIQFLHNALNNPNFTLLEEDLYTVQDLSEHFTGFEAVFHLSANADVRFGPERPSRDLEQNTIVTHKVLEACRSAKVKKFVFSSTGSVYGESQVIPTPENAPFPMQTSLYGASKLACEGMIEAYSESFGIQAWIFRFVSILGPRYTHGHVFDFYKQLLNDPTNLTVLGNGLQKKSYLHVSDCLSAICTALNEANDTVNILNLGIDDVCEVRDSINWITDELNVEPLISYGHESKGWIGDNPIIHLSTNKILSLGWKPKKSIESSVRDTVRYMNANRWIFGENLK